MKLTQPLKTFVLVLIFLFCFVGCWPYPNVLVRGKRFLPSSYSEGERIGVIVDSYEKCDNGQTEECNVTEALFKKKQSFVHDCITKAILNIDRTIKTIELDAKDSEITEILTDTQNSSVDDKKGRSAKPKTNQSLLDNFSSLNVKYIAILKMKTSDTNKHLYFRPSHDGVFVFGGETTRTTKLMVEIHETVDMGVAGELTSTGSAVYGWGIPVILILPLPIPLFSIPEVEIKTCSAMGEAIAIFVSGAQAHNRKIKISDQTINK